MKKTISIILIITTLITFIIPKFSFATETADTEETTEAEEEQKGIKINDMQGIMNNGEALVNGVKQQTIETPTEGEAIASMLALVSSSIAEVVRFVITMCVSDGEETSDTRITVQGIVAGEYPMLNNDFLLSQEKKSDTNEIVKEQVAIWYYGIRNLAIVISLLVLIYIGIRMAISTLADDKAKYKKMLISWLQSFILIFFLHYIILLAMVIQKVCMDVFKPYLETLTSPETSILGSSLEMIIVGKGWNIVWAAILYWMVTYYQIKFFFLYAKRMISTAFLIIIAPLITVTYSIDKVKDNEAQAFKSWLQEFMVNIFVQPVHIIVYLVFIVSASEIAPKLPLFTIIFFGALSRGEKVIKGVFGMRGRKSINSIGKHK